MCWSPTADVIAGGVITSLGIASFGIVARAGRQRVKDLPLAALPLVLGIHQLVESVVWLTVRNGGADGMSAGTGAGMGPGMGAGMGSGASSGVGAAAILIWTVIAYPLLPALVPLAVFSAGDRRTRARLAPFVVLGLATCAALAYAIASGPVTAVAVGHTMRYGVYHVPLGKVTIGGYLVATVGSLLASDQREVRVLGVVGGVGAAVCGALWMEAFVSTWCALAAVASLIVLRWVSRDRQCRELVSV